MRVGRGVWYSARSTFQRSQSRRDPLDRRDTILEKMKRSTPEEALRFVIVNNQAFSYNLMIEVLEN